MFGFQPTTFATQAALPTDPWDPLTVVFMQTDASFSADNSVSIPAGAQVGDLIVAIRLANNITGEPNITGGTAGYSLVYLESDDRQACVIIWKIAAASDAGGGSITFDLATENWAEITACFRKSTAFSNMSVALTSASSSAPSITPASKSLGIVGVISDDAGAAFASFNNGYATTTTKALAGGGGQMIAGYKVLAAAVASGIVTPNVVSPTQSAFHLAFN